MTKRELKELIDAIKALADSLKYSMPYGPHDTKFGFKPLKDS